MVIDLAPKSTNDATALMTTIIRPSRAKNTVELKSNKMDWATMVKYYEHDFDDIADAIKEAALGSDDL